MQVMMSSCPAKSKVCRVIESSSVPSSDLLLLTPHRAQEEIREPLIARALAKDGKQSVLRKTPYPCMLCMIERSAANLEESCLAPNNLPLTCISHDHVMKILGWITTLTTHPKCRPQSMHLLFALSWLQRC